MSVNNLGDRDMTKIKCYKRQENSSWSLYVNDIKQIDQDSFNVVDGVQSYLENPLYQDFSELSEVAETIRKTL